MNLANKVYEILTSEKIEVLLDDRNERFGVKLNDMDLIGIPYRIVIGKKSIDNIVELKKRSSSEILEIKISEIIEHLK